MVDRRSSADDESHPEGRLRDEILRRLERVEGGAWANRLAPASGFSGDDRRRITEYVGGITRRLRRLDFLVDSFSSRSGGIDPLVRQILRIGVYELVELRRAPHSSVYASVEQAKRLVSGGAGRFVNGILRTLMRNEDALPEPQTGDAVADAAIMLSHPDWLVRRWANRFGLDSARRLMEYDNRRPVHSIRVNTQKTTMSDFCETLDRLGVAWSASAYIDGFLRVEKLQSVIGEGVFDAGLAAIQDESAGLVGFALDPRQGEYVVDACAAPGGKMIHAAMLMRNHGRVVGIDLNEKRLSRGAAAARAHGFSIVETRGGDFLKMSPSESLPPADAVLVDAPCSGLGVLARRPDLRWRRSEASIRGLIELQDALLDAAAPFVKSGGRLVYATCTITPEENEERVAAFLARNGDFAPEPVSTRVPQLLVQDGCLASLPHVHEIDGAFAACLRRR